MVKQGQVLKVKTNTKNDVFGTCWYEVVATDLPSLDPVRREAGVKDGVKCVLLGGTGTAARPGYPVFDLQDKIAADIAAGVTEVVERSSVPAFAAGGAPKVVRSSGTGCVEI